MVMAGGNFGVAAPAPAPSNALAPMSPSPNRRRLVWIAAGLALVVGAWAAARFWLGEYAVRSVLRLAGASEISIGRVHGTPWQAEVEDLAFNVRTQAFAARRVTLRRGHWWEASLGDVRVEGARVPVVLDRSDVNPWEWNTYREEGLGDEPVQPPFRSLDLDGELVVRMATLPDLPVAIKLEGQPKGGAAWIGSLVAEGPGFRLAGSGSLLRAGQELDFQVHSAELDLGTWARHVQRLVLLPGGQWELGGRLTGVAEGRVTAKRFAATARVSLREGRMKVGARDIAAHGAEADLEFSDLWKFRTKSGHLRLAELRVGRLPVREITADFGLWDGNQFSVDRATGRVLGGRVEVEAFRYRLDQRALALNLRVEDLSAAGLMRLLPGVTPRLAGRLGGELAARFSTDSVQLDGGRFALPPRGAAELQLNAATVLRSGARLDEAALKVFKAASNQSVVVRLEHFLLEVRPPGRPLGTTARIEARGQVDGQPVSFVHHVNGAVERHLSILP